MEHGTNVGTMGAKLLWFNVLWGVPTLFVIVYYQIRWFLRIGGTVCRNSTRLVCADELIYLCI